MLLTKLQTGPEAESKSLSGHFWVIPMTHAKPHPYPQESSELCCMMQHPRWSRFWMGISGFGSLSLFFPYFSPSFYITLNDVHKHSESRWEIRFTQTFIQICAHLCQMLGLIGNLWIVQRHSLHFFHIYTWNFEVCWMWLVQCPLC